MRPQITPIRKSWGGAFFYKDFYLVLNIASKNKLRIPPSGMLRLVALVRTDVSEKGIAFIVSMSRIGELGTTLAVTSKRSMLRRNTSYGQLLLTFFLARRFFSPWWCWRNVLSNVLKKYPNTTQSNILFTVYIISAKCWVFTDHRDTFCVVHNMEAASLIRRVRETQTIGISLEGC
jgi:hypothetical protein